MATRRAVITPAGKYRTSLPAGRALQVRAYFPLIFTDDSMQYISVAGGQFPIVLSDGTNTFMPVGLNG